MRVLAVAQLADLLHGEGELIREELVSRAQVAGNMSIVRSAVLERLRRESPPNPLANPAAGAAQPVQHRGIVHRIAERDDVREVLGRRAQQSYAADVDLLQHGREILAGSAGSLAERIQVVDDD